MSNNIEIFENIEVRPIVIIANYRTSSSALMSSLANKYKIISFSEPSIQDMRYSAFSSFYNKNKKNFVLKFMIEQLDDIPEYRKILKEECYKIRLFRRDIISQIASYYIATRTKRFSQRKEQTIDRYFVRIVPSHLIRHIEIIVKNNLLLKTSALNFDSTIYAEDLSTLHDTELVHSTKPDNYQEILNATKYYYEYMYTGIVNQDK